MVALREGDAAMSKADESSTEASGVRWRKSRHSNPHGECLELAGFSDGQVGVRNSRHPDGEVLVFTRAEMVAFLRGAKDGEFDHLLE
ncbi:DUF397 domain-containing protein [Pseudonocardia sp.]|uniref:DUF397 domain-containing protein n=1 Tax=Pseudonocardia sp. TaxID=60912 RepID=UPI0039C94764